MHTNTYLGQRLFHIRIKNFLSQVFSKGRLTYRTVKNGLCMGLTTSLYLYVSGLDELFYISVF